MKSRSYIVGERGPELFTPGRSGGITSNRDLQSIGSGNCPCEQEQASLSLTIRTRTRGRVWLALAYLSANLGSRALPLTNWLWMRVRFEYSTLGGPWHRFDQPQLFGDG